MLKEFNEFFYDLNFIYIKELDPNIILKYMENFYRKFLTKYKDMEEPLLQKTAKAIIVAADDILLQKSPIKDLWIKNTGENYIFHTNRGGETLNNIMKDILEKRIVNWEVVTIFVTCVLMGVRSDYSPQVLNMYKKDKNYFNLNTEENLYKSSISKNKKTPFKFLYVLLMIGIFWIVLTECHYFFHLQYYVKETSMISLKIRSNYGY
jgi:hypothetical protein